MKKDNKFPTDKELVRYSLNVVRIGWYSSVSDQLTQSGREIVEGKWGNRLREDRRLNNLLELIFGGENRLSRDEYFRKSISLCRRFSNVTDSGRRHFRSLFRLLCSIRKSISSEEYRMLPGRGYSSEEYGILLGVYIKEEAIKQGLMKVEQGDLHTETHFYFMNQ